MKRINSVGVTILVSLCLSPLPSAWGMPSRGWTDPPGVIEQCWVCPDNKTADCMIAQPIYRITEHEKGMHITQIYTEAYSVTTGEPYTGLLSVSLHFDATTVREDQSTHWRRADGLVVRILTTLVYDLVSGDVVEQRVRFVCDGE